MTYVILCVIIVALLLKVRSLSIRVTDLDMYRSDAMQCEAMNDTELEDYRYQVKDLETKCTHLGQTGYDLGHQVNDLRGELYHAQEAAASEKASRATLSSLFTQMEDILTDPTY